MTIEAHAKFALQSLEQRTLMSAAPALVTASPTAYGMTIPTGHARLWLTPQNLATARQWYAAHPFTPASDDAWGNALLYQITGNTTAARNAINQLMNFTISSSELASVASDNYRWADWVPVVFDWCYDQMTATQRGTFMTRYDGYVSTMEAKGWGGVGMDANNYYWGYLRNEFNWAIATWYEDPNAAGFLQHAMVTRYQDDFLPWAAGPGAGGVPQEGTEYGRVVLQYMTVPWGSAEQMGRDVLGESDWYAQALYYLLYSTSPGPTADATGGYQLFPFDDDENSGGSVPADHFTYGDFVTMLAEQWSGQTVGQWARQWLDTVRPAVDEYVAAVDPGSPAAPYAAALPTDYYAPGPAYLWAKSDWSASATSLMFQLGGPDGVGHSHLDQGTFQLWGGGQWLTREETGYSGDQIVGFGGSGTADVSSTLAHNGILVNGQGQVSAYADGDGTVTRLESQPDYTFASVDLTAAYRAGRGDYDNPAAAGVVRDFLYVRPLGVLVDLDRVQSAAAAQGKTFLLHMLNAPTVSGNTVSEQVGGQVMRVTALTPGGQSAPSMRVVNERPASGAASDVTYGYRLEETASGATQQYLLNVIQAHAAGAADVQVSMTEDASGWTITLTGASGTAVVRLAKGMSSTGGSVQFTPAGGAAGATMPLATSVESITADATGVHWGASGTPTLSFSASGYTVNENGGAATVTVTRGGDPSVPVTVHYATGNGTATAGQDYAATSGTLSFAAGQTTATFTVPILDDSLAEANETVNLTLSAPGGGAQLGGQSAAVLTIVDDDQPGAAQFSASGYTVNEGAGQATVTVTRAGGSRGALLVNYATSDGTATAGQDYATTSGTLSFADGQTSATFTVPIMEDTLAEGNETVRLTLAPYGGGTSGVGSPSTALLTIVDDDYGPGPFTLFPGNPTPGTADDSDASSTEVGVKFTSDVAGYVTGVRFYKGSLNTGTHVGHLWDAAGNLLASVTFAGETASGWQQATFASPVAINANTTYVVSYLAPKGRYAEDDGYFSSAGVDSGPLHAPFSGGPAGVNGVYAAGGAFPSQTFLNANYYVDVIFSPGGSSDTTPPSVTAQTPPSGGTAVAVTGKPTVTFSESVQAGTISFVLKDANNNVVSATVSYNDATHKATLTPSASLAYSATYTLTVSGAKDQAGNAMTGATSWTFTTAAAPDTTPPTVIAQSPASGASGVATAVNPTVTFSEAVRAGTISFVLKDSNNNTIASTVSYDANTHTATLTPAANLTASSTYTLTVSGATDTSGNVMSAPVSWSFTTAAANVATIAFGTSTVSVDEDAGTATITITRSGNTGTAVSVNYATSDGTAVAGVNYTTASGTLSFGAGETSKTFVVTVLDDNAVTGNLTVNLTLSAATNGAVISGGQATAQLTVVNTDVTPSADPGADASAAKVAYGSDGTLYLAYVDSATGALDVQTRSTQGAWSSVQTVDASAHAGSDMSLAMDPSGKPGIAYYDGVNADLKYAHFNGSSWDVSTADYYRTTGQNPSLTYMTNGQPLVAYYDAYYGQLRLANQVGSAWTLFVVDSGGVGVNASIAYDPAVNAYGIGYQDAKTGALKYATYCRRAFRTSVIDASTTGGVSDISIKINPLTHNPAMSYFDVKKADLVYAGFTGRWSVTHIATARSQGQYSSLNFNSSGQPEILYYSATYGAINAATVSNSVWSLTRVVSGGVGFSEAVGSNGADTICWVDGSGVSFLNV